MMGWTGDSAVFMFGCVVLFFHVSEVCLVLGIEPEEFTVHSFLLSPAYMVAMCCGLLEYAVRAHLDLNISNDNINVIVGYIGFVLCVIGELFRKAAWFTARRSFTHLIKYEKRPQHELVTNGVYGWMRHPGYFGWLVWVVGTQLILRNPVCTVLFAFIAWRFFSIRIPIEETHLVRMFGVEYRKYRASVPTLIPGIP